MRPVKPVPKIVARGTVLVESSVTLATTAADSNPVSEKSISAAAAAIPAKVIGTGASGSTGWPVPKRMATRMTTANKGMILISVAPSWTQPAERAPVRLTRVRMAIVPSATMVRPMPEPAAGMTKPIAPATATATAATPVHCEMM